MHQFLLLLATFNVNSTRLLVFSGPLRFYIASIRARSRSSRSCLDNYAPLGRRDLERDGA
jgi:hypothetical protein